MNKLVSLLLLISLVLGRESITNQEVLQLTLNGLFEENNLPDPTTIVPCIDETTAGKIVTFIGRILSLAAKGSVSDIIKIVNEVKAFGEQIPQPVKDCLDGNIEFQALGLKYGIDNNTDSSKIEKKITQYVALHYFTVHKWFGNLDSQWKGEKYYQTGFDVGTYGHSVLKTFASLPNLTNKQILQQGLNGGFSQNGLTNPTTIIPCIDEETAGTIVHFIDSSLQKAARGYLNDLISLVNQVKAFGDKIPQQVKDCLDGNEQFKALGLKYGIDETADSSGIEKKVIAYITLHYLKVHGWFGTLNNEWSTGKYYQAGFDACTYGHSVLSITPWMIRSLIKA